MAGRKRTGKKEIVLGKKGHWLYISNDRSDIRWCCSVCGEQIVVNSLSDSITKRTKCEKCGDPKFVTKQAPAINLGSKTQGKMTDW